MKARIQQIQRKKYPQCMGLKHASIAWVAIAVSIAVTACVNGGNGNHSQEPVAKKEPSSFSKSQTAASSSVMRQRGVNKLSANRQSSDPSIDLVHDETEIIFDFGKRLDLAHLHSSGLLIDFGTTARFKYTLGDWKTGWRGNYDVDGISVSFLESRAARVFFYMNASEATEGKLVLRARSIKGTSKGRLYLNGESIGTVSFGTAFSHVSLDLKGKLRPSDNELLLRFDKAGKAQDGKFARLAVDYLRIIPQSVDERQAASSVSSVLTNGNDGKRDEILLRSGEALSYALPIPPGALVDVKVRSTHLKRSAGLEISLANKEHGVDKTVTREVGPHGQQIRFPLVGCENDVCILTLKATSGEMQFSTAVVRVPKRETKKAPGKRAATNVVLVLIDTLRADHLAAYTPDSRVQTRFLDKFATESMVFDRAWAQENWTKPSIASLLSGLYAAAHQAKTEKNKMPTSAVMIQEHLLKFGFETAGFVANGYVSGKFGFKRGWNTWTNYVREGKRNRAEFVADDAVKWLQKRNEAKPFYLYVHTIDPHVPYIPPAKYRALYDNEPYNGVVKSTETAKLLERIKTGSVRLNQRDKIRLEALYDGEITYHDEHLEKIYAELETQGLLENTVVIVTADHGEELFEHGSVGHGHTLYEELLHVPLFIRLPGAKANDSAVHFPQEVELVDVFSTICDLIGVEPPSQIQGSSLVEQLNGKEPNFPNAGFSEFMDGQLAVRTSRYKMIYRGLRTSLFDLKEDPRETSDLSDENGPAFVLMRDLLGLHMGQFVSGGELSSNVENSPKRIPKSKVLQREDVVIDKETREQLKALGYMGD